MDHLTHAPMGASFGRDSSAQNINIHRTRHSIEVSDSLVYRCYIAIPITNESGVSDFSKSLGLENILLSSKKYHMKTNKRHQNPRPHPKPRKFRTKKKSFQEINTIIPYVKTNKRYKSRPQLNPRKFATKKKRQKVRSWPFLASFS